MKYLLVEYRQSFGARGNYMILQCKTWKFSSKSAMTTQVAVMVHINNKAIK